MKKPRKLLGLIVVMSVLLLVIYFWMQRDTKPLSSEDKVNEVITIIKELDKTAPNKK